MKKRYFSFEQYCKSMKQNPEDVKKDYPPENWRFACDGAEMFHNGRMKDKYGRTWTCSENWTVEKEEKRWFSAKKWKEENKMLKSLIPPLYEAAIKTFVQDCDGAEITEENKMVGKSGGVYDVKNEDGVVYEKPIPEPREELTAKNLADLVKLFACIADDAEPEKAEPEENPPRYRIVIECDGDVTTAEMVVNGKVVRTSSAKRNPEDRFDFKVGAEYAFERLFKKELPKKFAEVGDTIRIVKADDTHGFYKNGDVFKVVDSDEIGVAIEVKNEHDDYIMFDYRKNTAFVTHEEYVVINRVKAEKPRGGFKVGDRIVVHGLVDNTYVNGMRGVVTGFDNGVHPDLRDKVHTSADPNPRTVTIRLDECPRNHEGRFETSLRRVFADKLKHE